MEIVVSKQFNDKFRSNAINCFYGDIKDLAAMDINLIGIEYDDEYTVKRFLNGMHFKLNDRIDSIFNYLSMDKKILNKKINRLSKVELKYVLLAYTLLNNFNYIIFDYFDVGLCYSELKKFGKILRELVHDGKNIIVASHDLTFLSTLSFNIIVAKDGEIPYDVNINDLFNNDLKLIENEEIIKFIKIANNRGADLEYTLNSQDLLKDIYRSVV